MSVKKYIKYLLVFSLFLLGAGPSPAPAGFITEDAYQFRMVLRIPRVYDNAKSLGRRIYQTQRITGEMLMRYDMDGELVDIAFAGMTNRTHRLSDGRLLTYPDTRLGDVVYPRFNAIGNNKTGKFDTASVCFYFEAEPSYNMGGFDEDNALYVMASGRGVFHPSKKYLRRASGKAAGTLGCGCSAYGHVSPTRRIGYLGATDTVDDVAAVDGTWSIVFKRRRVYN